MGGDVTDDTPQRMLKVDVTVAVGEDQDAVRARDAPPQEPDGVQGRGVSPLRVLDDEDRRARPRHEAEHVLHQSRSIARIQLLAQRWLGPRHVPEGVERSRDEQVVTGTAVDECRGRLRGGERGDQGALADARLAPDEDDLAAGRAEPADDIVQQGQLCVALQQHDTQHTLDRTVAVAVTQTKDDPDRW